MKCRKCAAQIPDNSVRCPNCGVKVAMTCPNCGASNLFGNKFCTECGFALLKKCSVCGAVNIYSANNCRKCNHSFSLAEEKETVSQELTIEMENNTEIQPKQDKPVEKQIENHVEIQPKQDKPVEKQIENNTEIQPKQDKPVEKQIENHAEIQPKQDELVEEKLENNEEILPKQEESVEEQIEKEVVEPFSADVYNAASTESDITQNILTTFIPVETEVETQIINDEKEENVNTNQQPENTLDIQEIEPLEEDIDIQNFEEDFDDDTEIINTENAKDFSSISIQQDVVENVITSLKTSITKHIIALQGSEGCGKTAVLKQTADILQKGGFLFLYGSCTPLLQITSFGFFQDAFLRIMGFPPYTKNTESFFKDFKKSHFNSMFSFLDSEELALFLNIFYPVQKDKFENILVNKHVMFSILEKVIKSFSLNVNLVIAIDNFELLDGASYDFIVYMLEKGYFNDRVKLIAAYQENKKIQSYFDVNNVNENIFEMINMEKLSADEMIESVNHSLAIDIKDIMPQKYLDEIIEKSNGNALRFEQEMALLFNTGYISVSDNNIVINEENKPDINIETFEELIKLRLNSLAPSVKNVLFTAAIMGYRFAGGILRSAVALSSDKSLKILDYLIHELFIIKVDVYTYEFKSLELWKIIFKQAQNDLLYRENSQRLYNVLKPLILSSNLQKLISCTEALSKEEEFIIWQDTASICAKLGDTNLYIIAQKQCLKLIDKQNLQNSEDIKSVIYEQLGKLLYKISPQEAISYLSNILDDRIKAEDVKKVIDLSSYFINSCYLSGNYFGAAEAVDAVVAVVSANRNEISDTDIALIKTRKLKALLNIGNCEQIINLVNEDIILDIERDLNSNIKDSDYKNILIEAWLNSKIILAKAFAIQGNNLIFNTINELKDFENKYKYNLEYYDIQINLIEAIADTISGDIDKSNEKLTQIRTLTKDSVLLPELLCEWNLINIINRLLLKDFSSLKQDLFELTTFSNNINEHFIKNILKLLLGYILKEEGDLKKAVEIYNDEIAYFAKEKVAVGALLAWLFIIQLNFESGDLDTALNTASKALEIAQSAKINNNLFIIYFEKYIAEVYMLKGDYTAASMYFEKAVSLANDYNLRYQLVELYIAWGKCIENFIKIPENYTDDNITLVSQFYEKALNCSNEIKINHLYDKALRAKADFNNFCRLNAVR